MGLTDLTKVCLRFQEELELAKVGEKKNYLSEVEKAKEYLSLFFINAKELKEIHKSGAMIYEYAFLLRLSDAFWVKKLLEKLLAEYREAYFVDQDRCFSVWNSSFKTISRAIRNIKSAAQLETPKDDSLNLELLTKSCFRDIGDILEGSLQPLVRLRLELQSISGRWEGKSKLVSTMSFGDVIAELNTKGDEYIPAPFTISVSQWRNIANHNSYEVENNDIVCRYGKGDKNSFRFKRTELIQVAHYIMNLYNTHKIAHEIFSLDNLEKIISEREAPGSSETNFDLEGTLSAGLFLSGFTILKVGHKPGVLGLFLTDIGNRSYDESKGALQGALLPFIVLFGPCEVGAIVQSRKMAYRFSFKSMIGT